MNSHDINITSTVNSSVVKSKSIYSSILSRLTGKFHHLFYILIILVLLIILIVTKLMSISSGIPTSLSLKGAYLNYASTYATQNGYLNPSDLAYPQIMEQRADMLRVENKIKKLINAPVDAKVIINSGATESIANCVFWAKSYNKYGTVVGSEYDHSAVEDNCNTFDVPYEQSLRSGTIDDRCCMIVITHVNSKTGEVVNVQNFKQNVLNKYVYEYTDGPNPYNNNVRQYRPLVILDATQSIMKVPIDMERWNLNAVFFSLHKIGGPIGMGVLVIKDDKNAPFKPLISGKQQHALRGGTFPLQLFLENEYIFSKFDDFNERKTRWEHGRDKLKAAGLKVYEPKGQHLYNTLLIDLGRCPLGVIHELAKKNIYVGNTSACKNEELVNARDGVNDGSVGGSKGRGSKSGQSGGGAEEIKPFDKAIRISFSKSKELSDSVLDTIISEIKASE